MGSPTVGDPRNGNPHGLTPLSFSDVDFVNSTSAVANVGIGRSDGPESARRCSSGKQAG